MTASIENWYNDPFNPDSWDKPAKDDKKDFRKFRYKKQRCTVASDGRLQRSCGFYFRDKRTHKCLFLMGKNECIIVDVD